MIYRDYQDIKLSGIALGMMRLPVINGDDGVIDKEAAGEMIDYAYQNGINYFDTAWGYHNGNSEFVAGEYLSKYPRDSYYLATKFPGYDNSNMGKVREIFEEQLKKCKTEYFDFYLFHNVYEGNIDDYLNPKFGILEYLLEQKKNGRIRYLGFSAHGSIEVIQRFLDAYGSEMEFGQLQLNYMDWHFQQAKEKAELLQKAGIPIWVMEPMRGGKLADVPAEMKAELLKMRPEESVPAWAYRFLQAVEGVTVVLSGSSSMEQLKENIEIWKEDKPLSKEEFDRLVELADAQTKKNGIPCTACHYCTSHCPMELPIPELLALYNEHKSTEGGFIAPMAVASMPEKHRPSNCISCLNCQDVCPQQIEVSEILHEFSSMIKM